MNSKLSYLTLLISLLVTTTVWSQTQTVRGTVRDADAGSPLIGATVRLLNVDTLLGATTDIQGHFHLEAIPFGRIDLLITSVGYENKSMTSVLVTAAKEVVLDVQLTESIERLDEVVVVAQKNKGEVLNEMALVSARSFSVEETLRYAGSLNDPARMVSGFAGVASDAEGNNDIVVRGNSPRGVLWRLEGVEIPNPNHFASEGATGGPVNSLNSNMLDNSDFYTGAFAPEFGNALSGVFDIRFKKGNNEAREHTLSASVFGVDMTMEGPFQKGYGGSYIANYRYSSLQLLSSLGILNFVGIPKYQDASFKINLPLKRGSQLSIFGLGGISSITGKEELDNGDPAYRGRFDSDLGVMGITHVHFFTSNMYLKNTLSASVTQLNSFDDFVDESNRYYNVFNSSIAKQTYRLATTLNYKFNARHKVESGWILSRLGYNATAETYNYDTDLLENQLDEMGSSYTLQLFSSWKYRVSEDFTMTSGLHYLYFDLSNSHSVEPRLAAKWQLSDRHAIHGGMGLHSRLESISTYLGKSSNQMQLNRNLQPSRAAHFVVGHDFSISSQSHIKTELYYQRLYEVPVENDPSSSFSTLNVSNDYVTDALINRGSGRNFGLEVTWERFFHQGYYFMSTLSLYQSYYTALDGVERSTAYNGNYIFNFLGGKEFKMGKPEKNKVFFVNGKVGLLGGGYYTPIDLEASRERGTQVEQVDRPYSQGGEDVFFLNLSIGTRRNKGNTTREFKIDVNNVTNHQAVIREYYLEPTEEIDQSTQLPFIPNIVYTFKF